MAGACAFGGEEASVGERKQLAGRLPEHRKRPQHRRRMQRRPLLQAAVPSSRGHQRRQALRPVTRVAKRPYDARQLISSQLPALQVQALATAVENLVAHLTSLRKIYNISWRLDKRSMSTSAQTAHHHTPTCAVKP